MYEELMMTIGSRRSGLNQNLALKSQYERALQDLADLLETGQEKTAGDQKIIVSSKEEIQQLLDKHKVKKKQKMSLNHVLFWLPWSLGVFSWGQQVLLLHDPTGQTWDCSTSMYDNQFQVRPCSLRKGCLVCMCAQSYPTLCNPMDHRLPGFSVHGMPV